MSPFTQQTPGRRKRPKRFSSHLPPVRKQSSLDEVFFSLSAESGDTTLQARHRERGRVSIILTSQPAQ